MQHIRLGMYKHPISGDCTETATEYDWVELWRAVVGLLSFLSNKLDSLITTGGVERLAQEVSVSSLRFTPVNFSSS
jgi:hypothetical protein